MTEVTPTNFVSRFFLYLSADSKWTNKDQIRTNKDLAKSKNKVYICRGKDSQVFQGRDYPFFTYSRGTEVAQNPYNRVAKP